MERFVILVSGRVQKVGYRSKVIALARDMRITGWVGNLPDGRVEVVAEGDAPALDRFVSALKVKNALIEVAGVEVGRQDATGEFKTKSGRIPATLVVGGGRSYSPAPSDQNIFMAEN